MKMKLIYLICLLCALCFCACTSTKSAKNTKEPAKEKRLENSRKNAAAKKSEPQKAKKETKSAREKEEEVMKAKEEHKALRDQIFSYYRSIGGISIWSGSSVSDLPDFVISKSYLDHITESIMEQWNLLSSRYNRSDFRGGNVTIEFIIDVHGEIVSLETIGGTETFSGIKLCEAAVRAAAPFGE